MKRLHRLLSTRFCQVSVVTLVAMLTGSTALGEGAGEELRQPTAAPAATAPDSNKSDSADSSARLQALIAGGDLAAALPLAHARARSRSDAESWAQVLQIAEWSSDQRAAIEALEQLVRLQPERREVRLKLAQQLLWTKQINKAVDQARWLLARPDERDPVALEVATWIFAEAKQGEQALAAAHRWLRADSSATSARWIIADLTHWSVRWRQARTQYAVLATLADEPEQVARAQGRIRLLSREHPDQIAVAGAWWSDNVGGAYRGSHGEAMVQLPGRLVGRVRAEYARWSHTTSADDASLTEQLDTLGARLAVRWEASNRLKPELIIGMDSAHGGRATPAMAGRAHLSHGGWLFGQMAVEQAQVRTSLPAYRAGIRATGARASLYAEPTRWIFAAGEAGIALLSDDNERRRSLLAIGLHNPHALQLEPRVFVQYDAYRYARPGAEPYFTPDVPTVYGGDVTVRYRLDHRLRLSATLGVVRQGAVLATLPGATVDFDLFDRLSGHLAIGSIGSPQYSQTRVAATVRARF